MSGQLGEQLATGRTAEVFAWDEGQIVKRFNDDVPQSLIDAELAESTTAFQLGATPIRCHGPATLPGGARGLIFDRLTGDSLATVAERDLRKIPAVSRQLARSQAALHQIEAADLPDVRQFAANFLDTPPLAALSAEERERLRAQLLALPDGDQLLHLDLHPLNVFAHDGGYAVIDWQSTCRGAPAADVAMTRLLFTEAELFPGISLVQRVLYQTVRRVMFKLYFGEYRRVTGMTDEQPARWATAVRVIRVGLLDIESERAALLTKLRAAAAQQP